MFGSPEQKEKFLPRAASGESKLTALALTEPGAGSDLQGGVRTRAEKNGAEELSFKDFETFSHTCPRCGFEFNSSKEKTDVESNIDTMDT